YGVGDINFFAIDAGFEKSFVKKLPCRADERFAFEIFLITGLLADEDYFRFCAGSLLCAEAGLRGVFPEVACFAIGGVSLQLFDGSVERKERGGWSGGSSF